MTLDPERWLKTLPQNEKFDEKGYSLNPDKWTDTIPKKNNPLKKYLLTVSFFILWFAAVPIIKNETRVLEKDIEKLDASIDKIKYELYQSSLDHDVLTSPENISKLAKEHLNQNLKTYKKNQIKEFGKETHESKKNKIKKEVKILIAKKIELKKTELEELKKMYSQPKKIPQQFKTKVSLKINKTKKELKQLYSSPNKTITDERVQRWALIQVAKAMLGMPIIPGK